MERNNPQDLYRIGTVASLTGIAVERLRAWERRYQLEPAHKSGRTRFYSTTQLHQLRLIKRLIDQGQPISSLAELSIEQLELRIQDNQQSPTLFTTVTPQIGLVGANLLMLEQQLEKNNQRRTVDVVSRWANIESFSEEQTGTDNPQVLFLQLPVLAPKPVDLVKHYLPNTEIVVIYQFATAKAVSEIEQTGVLATKWPINWSEIEYLAISQRGFGNQQTGSPTSPI